VTPIEDLKTLNHNLDVAYAQWQKEPTSLERESAYHLAKRAFDKNMQCLRKRWLNTDKSK
jgi:hypothetical protein